IAFTAAQALHAAISVGQFNQYMLAIVHLGGMLPGLAGTLGSLHEGNLYATRLFGFLDTPASVETARTAKVARSSDRPPRIAFERVSFGYPGTDRTVLTDLDVVIEPGESVALVGNNGAGKS